MSCEFKFLISLTESWSDVIVFIIKVLDPDMDSDSYSLSEDLDWMTPEEEEEKIMEVVSLVLRIIMQSVLS